MIDLILAVDKNGGIGKDNKILYKCKDDMKFFKEKRLEYDYLVCGRKTFESVGVLKGNKQMIVITHMKINNYKDDNVLFVDMEEFLQFTESYPDKKILCIGGKEIYEQLVHHANSVYITLFDEVKEADTVMSAEFATNLTNVLPTYKRIKAVEKDENNEVSFTIYKHSR